MCVGGWIVDEFGRMWGVLMVIVNLVGGRVITEGLGSIGQVRKPGE